MTHGDVFPQFHTPTWGTPSVAQPSPSHLYQLSAGSYWTLRSALSSMKEDHTRV